MPFLITLYDEMTCVIHDKPAKNENRGEKLPKVWRFGLEVCIYD